jgi:hypothetical protein
MSPKIIDDLQQAIEEHGTRPVHLIDRTTKAEYVILRADQYEKVKILFEDEGSLDPRETYPLVDRVMRDDDAGDPSLASYQTFRKATQ